MYFINTYLKFWIKNNFGTFQALLVDVSQTMGILRNVLELSQTYSIRETKHLDGHNSFLKINIFLNVFLKLKLPSDNIKEWGCLPLKLLPLENTTVKYLYIVCSKSCIYHSLKWSFTTVHDFVFLLNFAFKTVVVFSELQFAVHFVVTRACL